MKVGVIIAGGGQGRRLGGKTPKQFLRLKNVAILVRTIRIFDRLREVGGIVVVVPGGFVPRAQRVIKVAGCRKILAVVEGGAERQESVWIGLSSFPEKPEIVLVHDAVRPFATRKVVRSVIANARRYGGAVTGTKVTDTVKAGSPAGFSRRTLDREKLWAVQTPQGFRYEILRRAHLAAKRSGILGSDEASLVERIHVPVKIVPGEQGNVKITTKDDLKMAKMRLRTKK